MASEATRQEADPAPRLVTAWLPETYRTALDAIVGRWASRPGAENLSPSKKTRSAWLRDIIREQAERHGVPVPEEYIDGRTTRYAK